MIPPIRLDGFAWHVGDRLLLQTIPLARSGVRLECSSWVVTAIKRDKPCSGPDFDISLHFTRMTWYLPTPFHPPQTPQTPRLHQPVPSTRASRPSIPSLRLPHHLHPNILKPVTPTHNPRINPHTPLPTPLRTCLLEPSDHLFRDAGCGSLERYCSVR